MLWNGVGCCPALPASWKTLSQALPPPPNLWELVAARKPRQGGSTARPGKVPAASGPCSSSERSSPASCGEKHKPGSVLSRSSAAPSPSTTCPGRPRGGQDTHPIPRQLSAWCELTARSDECCSRKGSRETVRSGKAQTALWREMPCKRVNPTWSLGGLSPGRNNTADSHFWSHWTQARHRHALAAFTTVLQRGIICTYLTDEQTDPQKAWTRLKQPSVKDRHLHKCSYMEAAVK